MYVTILDKKQTLNPLRFCIYYARVAKLADAPDLGSGVLDVWVRIPPRVPLRSEQRLDRGLVADE